MVHAQFTREERRYLLGFVLSAMAASVAQQGVIPAVYREVAEPHLPEANAVMAEDKDIVPLEPGYGAMPIQDSVLADLLVKLVNAQELQ